MKIKGRHGEYIVKWASYGLSYAQAIVYQERSRWGLRWNKKLHSTCSNPWSSFCITWVEADRMYPNRMIEWFEHAVKEYEDYTDAWDNYSEGEEENNTSQ